MCLSGCKGNLKTQCEDWVEKIEKWCIGKEIKVRAWSMAICSLYIYKRSDTELEKQVRRRQQEWMIQDRHGVRESDSL